MIFPTEETLGAFGNKCRDGLGTRRKPVVISGQRNLLSVLDGHPQKQEAFQGRKRQDKQLLLRDRRYLNYVIWRQTDKTTARVRYHVSGLKKEDTAPASLLKTVRDR